MNHLQFEGTDTSKLPDKSPSESIRDLAPRTEAVLEKHLTENLVEVSITTKESLSPREPKAELSGKLVGKRSLQQIIELSDNYDTKRPNLQGSRTVENKVSEVVSQKQLTESIHEKRGKMIKPYDEVSNKLEGKMLLVEVDNPSADLGKVINSEDDPALTPATNILNNKNSFTGQKDHSIVRRKTKKKEKFDLPYRSSKRLAGQQPEPVNILVTTVRGRPAAAIKSNKGRLDAGLASDDLDIRAPLHTSAEVNSTLQGVPLTKVKSPAEDDELQPINSLGFNEQTHQVASGESSGCDVSRVTASGNFVNGASLQDGALSEAEDFFDSLDDINSTSHELLNNSILLLNDQVVSKEQHHKLVSGENPEKLSILFQDDSCSDFSYQIITGELSINYEPILERAADMVQKEKPVATGSCSGNATAKFCSSKAIQAVDLADKASQQHVAIQEMKVANDIFTIINSSDHEVSLKTIEKFLENQTAAEEKPHTLETEEAAVENPFEEFSFPFQDTWPDSDPFFGLAFQSFKEDDLFRGYFQENLDTIYKEVNSPAPPSFFE
ncbi:uncharacterized protein LOC126794929 [Argentina anserina]|uniref:uncharacterized protein LOC126794929 n=1 Tax=Argentina anserina TaxID=57926 RepID=UPI0021765A1E|nr:uncharacterized protein LOC126794929 [Potentilla anserina]